MIGEAARCDDSYGSEYDPPKYETLPCGACEGIYDTYQHPGLLVELGACDSECGEKIARKLWRKARAADGAAHDLEQIARRLKAELANVERLIEALKGL